MRGWGAAIKGDPNMLIGAANRADKAVNMILGIEDVQIEQATEEVAA